MALYPSQHFPYGAAFVCQAGNFCTLLRICPLFLYSYYKENFCTRMKCVSIILLNYFTVIPFVCLTQNIDTYLNFYWRQRIKSVPQSLGSLYC